MDTIDAIVSDLETFTEQRIIQLSIGITNVLIVDTPRDTSWARANWIPSVGSAFEYDAPNEGDPALVASIAAAGQAELLSFKLSDQSTFVTNNVPYITILNEGWSKQAPAGFVQAAVARKVRELETV